MSRNTRASFQAIGIQQPSTVVDSHDNHEILFAAEDNPVVALEDFAISLRFVFRHKATGVREFSQRFDSRENLFAESTSRGGAGASRPM